MRPDLVMEQKEGKFGLIELFVSIYLCLVVIWLIASKSINVPSFTRILRALFRPKYDGELSNFSQEEGHCWIGIVPDDLLTDKESTSRLVIYEDGSPLLYQHCSHGEIRSIGLGRYSHWGREIYFASSDNTSPISNGRKYTVREV